ncbi:hypothetical protein ACIBHY_47190 [Nonomuraea sp. NPDC050547]|uniref:hypothetical protein n=1 Tax=Nonomuraea sp. NPDC050547 TaxID=3364368 RepID=UPI0037AD61F8
MGEFVGIDPRRAEQLMREMAGGQAVLGRARPGLEAAIAEAGPSWTGPAGTTAMHQSWAFLDETQRDLKWRVDTLRQMVPGTGLLSGSLPFFSETEAARQGTADGRRIADALKELEIDHTVETWRAVTEAAAAATSHLTDPAYAAALLNALGPDRFRALFMHWMKNRGPAMDKGLPPGVLQQSGLGPLAQAYANAERAGRLDTKWLDAFVETTQPGVLTALITLSRPSSRLLNQVATRVLGRPLAADLPTSPNWNLNALIDAYTHDPAALQSLLATNKNAAGWLLHPQRIRLSGVDGLQTKLAAALNQALAQGPHRDQAMFNIIRTMGAENSPWISTGWGIWRDSPISETLAANMGPYLDQLARAQSQRDSPELTAIYPTSPWNTLTPDDASRFVGVLMQDADAAKLLMKASQDYTLSLDIGRFRPFGDEATQDQYTSRAALAGGVANLMLSGTTYAEWADDEYADWVAGVALLPVSWLSNKYWPIQNPTTATGRDIGLDAAKDGLKGLITDYLDKRTPATAKDVGDSIVYKQVQWITESLNEHGQKPLTASQRNEVRMAFRGRLYEALVTALKQRGG